MVSAYLPISNNNPQICKNKHKKITQKYCFFQQQEKYILVFSKGGALKDLWARGWNYILVAIFKHIVDTHKLNQDLLFMNKGLNLYL